MKTGNYEQQAENFLKEVNGKVTIKYHSYGKHFEDDKEERNIYLVTISRNNNEYSFKFGDSINNSQKGIEPSIYDVLSCLTKENWADFNQFCGSFGYSEDSIKALKIYKAVQREFEGVNRVFGDVLNKLEEIQ